MMETRDYLAYISKVIHTTIAATVDDEGLPVTAAIDMMDSDDNSLYFLTARGKGFYDRLIKRHFLALTAIKGEDSMSSVAVSVRGKVRSSAMTRSRNSLKRIHTCTRSIRRKNPCMHCRRSRYMKVQANGSICQRNRLRERLSRLAAPKRSRKDFLLPIPVLAAEGARRSALRTALLPTVSLM